jgi:hypothetical protein
MGTYSQLVFAGILTMNAAIACADPPNRDTRRAFTGPGLVCDPIFNLELLPNENAQYDWTNEMPQKGEYVRTLNITKNGRDFGFVSAIGPKLRERGRSRKVEFGTPYKIRRFANGDYVIRTASTLPYFAELRVQFQPYVDETQRQTFFRHFAVLTVPQISCLKDQSGN